MKDSIRYEPITGLFRWQTKPNRRIRVNDIAGYRRPDGYLAIRWNKLAYYAHRLAWEYVYGEIPKGMEIDHRNGIRDDNRIKNLRLVTSSINKQNRRKAQSNNISGLLGVSPDHGRWQAQIKVSGKRVYLGAYDTPEEAHEAYLIAKRQLHEGNTL